MRFTSASARGLTADDPATLAAKRVFGIADPLLLERRAGALAEAAAAPLEALDLALANWASEGRATLGFPATSDDEAAFELAERGARPLSGHGPRAAPGPVACVRRSARRQCGAGRRRARERGEIDVHSATYSPCCQSVPRPQEPRCHSASSSLRMRSV